MTGFAVTDIDADAQAAVPGWEHLLDPGERIVWQGRPDQSFHIAPKDIPGAIFSLVFVGFAVFWMTMAAASGGAFWMFGLIHFTVGLNILWKSVYGATARRRSTWYTLTDRRAFVATETRREGKTLQSYPITPDTRIRYTEGTPATIHFASERKTGSKGRSYTKQVGFERIGEGRKVLALLNAAQRREVDT